MHPLTPKFHFLLWQDNGAGKEVHKSYEEAYGGSLLAEGTKNLRTCVRHSMGKAHTYKSRSRPALEEIRKGRVSPLPDSILGCYPPGVYPASHP